MNLFKLIKYLFLSIHYQRILNKIYTDDQTISKISYMLGAQVMKDNIGRLYTVINPEIRDGKFHPNQAYEFNEEGNPVVSKEEVERWIMQRMNMVQEFITANNLFDMLTYEIKPLENNNFLLILTTLPLKELLKHIKGAIIELLILITIIITLIIFL